MPSNPNIGLIRTGGARPHENPKRIRPITKKQLGVSMKRTYGANYIGEVVLGMALVAAVCAAWHAVAGGAW